MARRNFAEFILKIDYHNANNGHNLTDLAHTARDDITFAEVKAAFNAFITKIGIKELQSRHTGPYWAAYTTIQVLTGLLSTCVDNEDSIEVEAAEMLLTVWIAMVAAGPNSSHTDMMEVIMTCTPDLPEYVETLPAKRIAGIIKAMDITFTYAHNEEDTESTYASFVYNKLNNMYNAFTEDQLYAVQKEFLHVYHRYHLQLPKLSEDMALQINYLIRGMAKNFEEENPYLRLKDVEIFKKHITMVKDIACSAAMAGDSTPVEETAERTLKLIVKALIEDSAMFEGVFDHLMRSVVQLVRNDTAREYGNNLFDVIRLRLFREMEDSGKAPSDAVFNSCIKMLQAVFSDGHLTESISGMVKEAMDGVLYTMKKATPEQAKAILGMVKGMLESGMQGLVSKATKTIDNGSYKGKVFVWKDLAPEVSLLIDAVGDIPTSKMIGDPDDVCRKYRDFVQKLLETVRKVKVLPKIQKNLIGCIFNCLQETTVYKAQIAEECSDDDNLDLSKVDKDVVDFIIKKVDTMLKDKSLPWEEIDLILTTDQLLSGVLKSYFGRGNAMTSEQNDLLLSIVKTSSDGDSIEDHFYQDGDEDKETVYLRTFHTAMFGLTDVMQKTKTEVNIAPAIPYLVKWAGRAVQEDYNDINSMMLGSLQILASVAPESMKDSLPHIVDLFVTTGKGSDLIGMMLMLYPLNPKALHDRLPELINMTDSLLDSDRQTLIALLFIISQKHAEVFTTDHVTKLLKLYKSNDMAMGSQVLFIIRAVSEKRPKYLEPLFPSLVDDNLFKPESLNIRAGILACVGGLNKMFSVPDYFSKLMYCRKLPAEQSSGIEKSLGHQAIDYMMKYANYHDPSVVQAVLTNVRSIVGKNVEHMQKHRALLEQIETTTTIPSNKEACHQMILILDGKSIEDVIEDVQQQQEDIADLDTKVDATIGTVTSIGDEVVDQRKNITSVKKGIEDVEERVDDAEDDIKDTKVKVEEIDNKTMTNAPKWSRDLTKLMNPATDNDWRLLASRLGYSNDDIRGWAQQHDPCMALLSEWYATHKTSEASHAVLTALQEMNRMDGVVIVENAMKAADGVVEDEEFEYASPPPIFLSYQWGMQDEVKLLQRHLSMAGYECWMDIGQMGGGDKLFAKIDNGIRAANIVICCTTEKYAKSPNCNREVNLSVNLGKPIIPLLMEKMDWPPKGSMGPIFSEYLFIRFFQRGGEETKDQRYWPVPKFKELLMQLNFYVDADGALIKKEYKDWWKPMVEDIVIDKDKNLKKNTAQAKHTTQGSEPTDVQPLVFLSYQWGKQPQIKALYQRLTRLGYTVWMDIYQMGGGDSLYDKIDRGLRGCKAVVSCVTPKYSLSANCRREISLADALKKPVIPLLLEEMKWPPDGPMSMVFTELLYINFYRDPEIQMSWKGPTFDELTGKLRHHVPEIDWTGSGNTQAQTKQTDSGSRNRPPTKATPSDTRQNGKTAVVAEPKPDVKSAQRVAIKTTPVKAKAAPKTNDASRSKMDSKPTPDKQAFKSVPPNKKGTDISEAIDKTTAKRTPAASKAVSKASNDTQSNMAKTKSEAATGKSLSTPSRKATEAKGNVGTEPKGNGNVSSTTNSNSKPSKSCSIL